MVLREAGQTEEAIAVCRRAIELDPGNADAYGTQGITLSEAGRLDEAIATLGLALQLEPDSADVHNNLGVAWHRAGECDRALTSFRRAIEHKPDHAPAASNLLFTAHFHPDHDALMLLAEHRRWAGQFARPLAAEIQPHPNDRTPKRKLRVGFVSPDFRSHPVGRLLRPLFAHRDRGQAEFLAYSDVHPADDVTHELETLADGWRSIAGMSDARVADQIRRDQVDILVDLALHTATNRMLVFARKPAPVQVTMLGLATTTGLGTIDYRLTDPYIDPPGQGDIHYSEQSIRLPHCFWCYEPALDADPVAELPARRNGFVTFGCLNQFAKVNKPVLQLWARILQSVPGARLVLQSPAGAHQGAAIALFADAGVTPDRIEFAPMLPFRDYLARYHDLDLCLDPFPFCGGTTTMDALWMGAPVITLAGRTAVGRGGVSILSNLGLTELIAHTPEQYVAIAVAWGQDWHRLAKVRAGLRQRMKASPLADGRRYAADVEAALRRMWKDWCSQ
jgi:predicted O-linked N-acetylglucosamine transferase (SPINDLY family)